MEGRRNKRTRERANRPGTPIANTSAIYTSLFFKARVIFLSLIIED